MIQEIRRHRWIYATMAGGPVLFHAAFFLWMATCPKDIGTNTTQIPTYAWPVALAFLPVLTMITGMIVGKIFIWFKEWWPDLRKQELRPAYTGVFVISWILIFGFYSVLTFLLGLGGPPVPVAGEEFFYRFGNVLRNFPVCAVISVAVCAGATGIAMVVLELTSVLERNFAEKT